MPNKMCEGRPNKFITDQNSGYKTSYTYDNLGRMSSNTEKIEGIDYTYNYYYDDFGNVSDIIYPDGFTVNQTYDSHGYLTGVNADGVTRWAPMQISATGKPERDVLGNNVPVNYVYDYYDNLHYLLTGTPSDRKQFFMYNTDPATGNMNWRKDGVRNITENFTYDNLNRLTDASILGQTPTSLTYQPNGNIDTKGDVGGYNYDPAKIHAVVELAGNPGTVPEIPQNITYTSFNKIKTVTEGDFSYLVKYGPDEERRVSELTDATTGVTTKKVYVGGYEIQSDGTTEKKTHYIMGNGGPVAMMVSENNTDNYYYFCKDHLGSVTGLLDQNGNMAEEYNYDAWGRRRNPTDWTYDNVSVPTLTDRGFTFHEHMDKFGLINMNGRMYDPLVGRMLSPDPMMQAAGSTQGLNRYSYCFNNPLKYVDPSGYHTAMPDMSYIQANYIFTGSGWIEPNYLKAMLTGDAGRYQDLVARGEIMGMPTAMLGSSFGDVAFNNDWDDLGNYTVERKIKYNSPSKMDKNSSYTEAFVFNVSGPGDPLSPESLFQRFENSFIPLRSALIKEFTNPNNRYGNSSSSNFNLSIAEDISQVISNIDFSTVLRDETPVGANPVSLRLTSLQFIFIPLNYPVSNIPDNSDWIDISIVPEENRSKYWTGFGIGPYDISGSTKSIIVNNALGTICNVLIITNFEVITNF